MLKKAIHDMPNFEPDPQVWNKIVDKLVAQENRIGKHRNVIIRKLYSVPVFWRMAAVIVLCLTIIIFLKENSTKGNEKVSFCYQEENIQADIDTILSSVYSSDSENIIPEKIKNTLAQINKVCEKQPEICIDTIFTAIRTHIDTLDLAINNTAEKIRLYPEEEGLLKIKSRLENDKNKTIKKLIQYVVS